MLKRKVGGFLEISREISPRFSFVLYRSGPLNGGTLRDPQNPNFSPRIFSMRSRRPPAGRD